MLWLLIFIFAIVSLYWILIHPYKYWTRKGVKQSNPTILFGDNAGTVFQTQSMIEMQESAYKMFPNSRYSGIYQFLLPTLIIRDPDLIKQITVKDFDHFVDHQNFIPEDIDPLWANNLIALTGKKWRDMRATLSPTFTSSKMKIMFTLISQNGERLVKHLLVKNKDIITFEMKDLLTRFTKDVIANAAFGIECDSLNERTNEFYLKVKEITDFNNFWTNLKVFAYILSPKLSTFFGIRIFSEKLNNFFANIIKSNIKSREEHGIVRPDMIHLLLQTRKHAYRQEKDTDIKDTSFATAQDSIFAKNHKQEITDNDIISQALIFLFAGFETVSTMMCFMAYELAVNPDVQKRLIEEVDAVENFTYEVLADMKYLDMVVCETLRKWPNASITTRVCTKPYTIQPKLPNEKPLHLEVNSVLWIPIMGIHRDTNDLIQNDSTMKTNIQFYQTPICLLGQDLGFASARDLHF